MEKTEQNVQMFGDMMGKVAELYRTQALSRAALMMYWNALERYSFQEVRQALNLHMQNPDNGQFFPKPADIIRQIGGDTVTQAAAAWSKVDYAIRTSGPWVSVIFDDAITHKVIEDMGGWIALCGVSADEYPFKANEFKVKYRGYIMRPPETYPRILTGKADSENKQRGLPCADPTVIGKHESAALVYYGGSDEARIKTSRLSIGSLMNQVSGLIEGSQK